MLELGRGFLFLIPIGFGGSHYERQHEAFRWH